MRTHKHVFVLLLSTLIFASCSSNDDNPEIINEEELITTVRLTLTDPNGNTVVMDSQDLDGIGPDEPIVNVTGTIMASAQYAGSVQFLNETETPADNITLEILEEDEDHQVFYEIVGASGSTVSYTDLDSNGNPIGININFNSGVSGTDNVLTLTLVHLPNKEAQGVSDGSIANAGGETDAEVSFPYTVSN